MHVLDRGLKFVPTQNLNKFQTYVNIQKCVRTLNIKKYFLSNPINRKLTIYGGVHSNLLNKSTFNPPNIDNKYLEVFKNMVFKDLEGLKVRKVADPQYVRIGMESLEKQKEIIICPADTGGGLVVLSESYYQNEMCHFELPGYI